MDEKKDPPERFRLEINDGPDIAFSGWLIGDDQDEWPEIDLYYTTTNKYVFVTRSAPGPVITQEVHVFKDRDELLQHLTDSIGLFKGPVKRTLIKASSFDPKFREDIVREI